MINLKADIEGNENLANNKLVSALRDRIVELYQKKAKDKHITVSAIVKGEALELNISVGSKSSSLNRFKNAISHSEFRNETTSDEFVSKERAHGHNSIMDKIMKIVMKEFPSLFHKAQQKRN